ncbi:MAG: radical SAM protein [Spirochaetae bacterium HGW-Spirochaetae-1]|jgi:wyosine [tRNA(Phe)-imidazoG37] synthetase (radical SAM superfamily)|nr:MAG: radical SAM protein [Spirochaetae bacterium HGW-Spirochaetae-1]
MKYVFGPVNSRRLGISLGIDLVPHKTCSLNCIYCECGETTDCTALLREYVPVKDVLAELDSYLSSSPELDVLTFSGSGEPTLHSGIGTIIAYLKERYPRYPVVVLTNGTLLWKEEVREALVRADIIIPSLDAVSEPVFRKMLRPTGEITAERLVRGLMDFRPVFAGRMIIEIFILPGVNDTPDELARLKEACEKIGPDEIQLNRLDRPGAVYGLQTASWKRLVEIKEFFLPLAVEIIGKPDYSKKITGSVSEIHDAVGAVLKRRPSTIDDLSRTLGLRKVEVMKIIEEMDTGGILSKEEMERGIFYRMRADAAE